MKCPVVPGRHPEILLAHGGGGKLTQQLIEEIFIPAFSNPLLEKRHDGAVFDVNGTTLAFTTDSYVVHPLFFPGGDIGSLSVYGTVNDLAMCGARPLYLSAGFIIEEGLAVETLKQVAESMRLAAEKASVQLVTGDTKVVDRGKGDGIFINTAGVGVVERGLDIAPAGVRTGDKIILSGDLGRHGVAIMAVREGLSFGGVIESDSAPLWEPVEGLLKRKIGVHCLRDLTRGGLASALNEIAGARGVEIRIHEEAIPLHENVRGACEILGLDPLYVANEGRFIAFVSSGDVREALSCLGLFESGAGATVIGEVCGGTPGLVTMKNTIGTHRVIDRLDGEQLPRIC
ncbi:MAG: hydrogenase expression/formation protein HypE [Candidatus Omnitrophica bacterium]|nr:hydrogenase expression/formation protein HypE [Candidatus Omnitrophota bacterium]